MKRLIQLTFISLVAIIALTVTPLAVTSVSAIDVFSGACDTGSTGTGSTSGSGSAITDGAKDATTSGSASSICGAAKSDSAPDIIKNVINTALVILGMITVVMIVIGGIRYTTSNGDASSIKGAKDTILYAVVGLIVAILAYAIVNFVLGRFSGN